ncbi:hypothetical protein V0288_00610 [Pannus brasiliensis CCIBt3594]|uniref:MAE-28990/MAE-18760-like HEPN domain-containing protein n=1 Tax=Pannus brasiliensis CCIBt3594 TaxID=1427578 RepID=A0AAW9QNJ8_9CHRO
MKSNESLIALDQHCAGLAHILSDLPDGSDWDLVCDWLMIAASIRKIKVETTQHNLSFGWCALADEYDIARQDLLTRFVEACSVFNFTWGALEATLNIIKLPKPPKKSKNRDTNPKIFKAYYYLNQEFASKRLLTGLVEEVNLFRESASVCLDTKVVNTDLLETTEFGFAGIGLLIVSQLRNQFAHGSLTFPVPLLHENDDSENLHESMIKHATRVVLIQLQMLLLAYFKRCDNLVTFSWHPNRELEKIPFYIAIQTCHLEQGDANFQISLL